MKNKDQHLKNMNKNSESPKINNINNELLDKFMNLEEKLAKKIENIDDKLDNRSKYLEERLIERVDDKIKIFRWTITLISSLVAGLILALAGLGYLQIKDIIEDAIKKAVEAAESKTNILNKKGDSLLIALNERGEDLFRSYEKQLRFTERQVQREKDKETLSTKVAEKKIITDTKDLMEVKDPVIKDKLTQALKKEGNITNETIKNIFNSTEIEDIKKQLQSDNYSIRYSAAKFLGSYEDKTLAVNLLIERLKVERDWMVRYAIVESLGKLGTSDAKDALIKVRDEKFGPELVRVRDAAKRELNSFIKKEQN